MFKRLILLGTVLALLVIPVAQSSTAKAGTGHRIVIDPGHGGWDSGSAECSLLEKDANLQIAQMLRDLLEADGFDVYMTREIGNDYKSNADRYNFANSVNGEALVSIHLNGSTDHTKNGTLGLYGKRNKDKAFAKMLHVHLASDLNVPNLGVTNFASGVLLKSNMPATIQEAVFISNEQECRLLTDGSGQRQLEIAQSLYNGLVDWFEQEQPPEEEPGNGKKGSPPGHGK